VLADAPDELPDTDEETLPSDPNDPEPARTSLASLEARNAFRTESRLAPELIARTQNASPAASGARFRMLA